MSETVLETRHITKRYGALTAVDDLSLSIQQGEIFGFLGPNGAGKTTSINMMSGLLKPDAGQVLLRGKPLDGGAQARARVGVCPQEAILWDKLTCLEQLEFIGEMYAVPRKTARQRGSELLEALGLGVKARELGCRLSGGMKRRLNLALALVHDPEILALDEPEAGLDPQSRALVREFIRSLARRKTIILTTHNMDEAERLADRVAIIDQGRLLVLDTPDALKRTVGKGDVLEIRLSTGCQAESFSEMLSAPGLVLTTASQMLTVRGHRLVERLPGLMESLRQAGAKAEDVRLRANTLEDVFLALTGRRLRE